MGIRTHTNCGTYFVQLHAVFKIFNDRAECEKHMSLNSICMLAADRWRIMCKHIVMLAKSQANIPKDLTHLQDVISLIKLGDGDPPAVPAAASSSEPMPVAAAAPPAEPALQWWLNQPVPYTGGVIDWEKLEEDLPEPYDTDEFECEIMALDFSKPQSSAIHPYYHPHPDADCQITGHKCNCEKCREAIAICSPVRKRTRAELETQEVEPTETLQVPSPSTPQFGTGSSSFEDTYVVEDTPPANKRRPAPAAPAEAEVWSSTAVSGSPPPVGIGATENLLAHIENLANTAAMPATATVEKKQVPRQKVNEKVLHQIGG